MLILTRKPKEAVVLTIDELMAHGGRIVVTVLDIRGCNVRIGFDAPKAVGVYRTELLERIERNERGG